jgi:hypothetical protein
MLVRPQRYDEHAGNASTERSGIGNGDSNNNLNFSGLSQIDMLNS